MAIPVNVNTEEQLALLLARGKLSNRVQEQARALLRMPLNWEMILERVTAEEVYPLFYRNLEKLGISDCGLQIADYELSHLTPLTSDLGPLTSDANDRREQACEQLQKLSKINAFRNALLTEELVGLLKLLSDAGIPTIPLKGVALAQSLYGDPSLRTCVDIDVLVPRSMVARALNLLHAEGYASEFGPGFFANLLLRHDIEYALRRADHGFEFMVELHWGVLWGGKLEESVTDQLWADAHPATVFGAPAYALGAEWQILFLTAHAARHQWQGLKWLVDLHELYSFPDVEWEKLDKKAKQLGWQELLRISFLACYSLFQTPIPDKYLVGELPSWVKLFPKSPSPMLNGAFFATRLMKSASEKVCYIARVLFVPTLAECRLISLPDFLGPLYYPLRPLRLLCKWSGAAVRRVFAAGRQRSEVGDQDPEVRGQKSEVSGERSAVRSRDATIHA